MQAYSIFAAAADSVLPQPKALVLKAWGILHDYSLFTSAKGFEQAQRSSGEDHHLTSADSE
jgi:hypothetical protein